MAKDDRLFAPFPIEMDEHPKIIGLTDAAFRAIFEATFYSRRMLSDGFLDERIVLRKWGKEVAEELSTNDPERPSWIPVEHGWQIHDFEKHHPLRAEIEMKRSGVSQRRSEAGKVGAAKRWDANKKAPEWQDDGKPDGKPMANDSSETQPMAKTTNAGAFVTRRKPEQPLPDSWKPSQAAITYAQQNGIDAEHEAGQFRSHAAANDRRQRDWDAAFRTWMGRAKQWAPTKRQTPTERAQQTLTLATEIDMKGIGQ